MLSNKEALIREQRTIEANRSNLLGPGSKFGIILRNLGDEILMEGGNMCESSYLSEFDEIDDPEKIPTMDIDSPVHIIGICYDGMKRGLHLTIVYRDDLHELTVRWRGDLVFQESGGELLCYVPDKEWEINVDRIYELACEKEKVKKAAYEKQVETVVRERHRAFLDEMHRKWGYK